MNKTKAGPSLAFCLVMDAIGYFTYAVPLIGEFADIIWAPISAIVFMISFGGWKGITGGLFNFAEEILPGTDFIPSFTIAWMIRSFSAKKDFTENRKGMFTRNGRGVFTQGR